MRDASLQACSNEGGAVFLNSAFSFEAALSVATLRLESWALGRLRWPACHQL